MKEYFEEKAKELGLDILEASKDFGVYLKQNPEYKVTKANITKFLKSIAAEPENQAVAEQEEENHGTYIGKDPVTGKRLFR